MEKIAIGPGYPAGTIDLNRSATENVEALAKAKGVKPAEIIACVLDRPRHEKLIAELRGIGCGIMLIPDGDGAGVIATSNPDTMIDILIGCAHVRIPATNAKILLCLLLVILTKNLNIMLVIFTIH